MTGFDPRTDYESSNFYESDSLYNGFEYKGPNPGPWKVELGVDLFANGIGDWFTLDDPIQGELDNVVYLLAGEVFIDITRYARRISTKRGRSRLLEKFTTGACEVVLDNRDRLFDPLLNNAPLSGQIVPRKQLKISFNSDEVFTGNVSDWDFEYDNTDATATVKAVDGFQYLATRNVPVQTMTTELTGARVNHVLDQVGWPTEARLIDAGSASVAADEVTGNVNSLAYLQKIELSQNGLFFIQKNGLLRFGEQFQGTYTPAKFGGDSGIPYRDIDVIYGSEELTNKVDISFLSGSVTQTVTVDDPASQSEYGVFQQSFDTLLSGSVDAAGLGQSLVNRFGQPAYRVERVSFDGRGLDSEALETLMDLDLGNRARLFFRPLNVGEPVDRTVLIDAIEHDASPSRHVVNVALTDLGYGGDPPIIDGGFISEYVDNGKRYRLHSFTQPGVYTMRVFRVLTVDALVIGGGGGILAGGGGGGAGGLLQGSFEFPSIGDFVLEVGAFVQGSSGGDSSFVSLVADGGGVGGGEFSINGAAGGSGGGGYSASPNGVGGAATQTNQGTLTGFGNAGSDGIVVTVFGGGTENWGGGGGGAGGSASNTFVGGVGLSASITGSDVTYALGGDGYTGFFGGSPTLRVPNPGDGFPARMTVGWSQVAHGAVFIRYEIE